ncbi:MAG: M23 family metallopeptidase [Methylobacterium mesophilicum]|nr:M23 family metallopeptidase [Methylobacterium mesophilicum]
MQFKVSRKNFKHIGRGAALLLLCSTAAGCSSTVSRFGDGIDDFFTASTKSDGGTQQTAAVSSLPPAPSGQVQRSAMAPVSASPVSRSELSAPTATASAAPASPRAPAHEQTAAAASAQSKPQQVAMMKPAPLPKPAPVKAPVVAEAPKPAPAAGGYVVASGDTLNKIAQKMGTTAEAIRAANDMQGKPLRVGQALVIPQGTAASKPQAVAAAEAPKAAPAATEAKPVAYTPPPAAATKTLQDVESDKTEAPGATGIGKMRWPVRGRVVQTYGSSGGKSSDGIDIAVPEGTPVKAAENGVVIYAGDGLKEFGNTVLVRHENGLVTVYGHASEIKVKRGEKVSRGQDIALSGATGQTDSPKLHFEVRKNSAPVNPSGFLE